MGTLGSVNHASSEAWGSLPAEKAEKGWGGEGVGRFTISASSSLEIIGSNSQGGDENP